MSFSLDVKNELSRIEETDINQKKYGLAGLLRTGLSLRTRQGNTRIMFITENATLLRLIFSRVKELSHNSPEVAMLKTRRFRVHTLYYLEFTPHGNEENNLLKSMGISVSEDGTRLIYEPIEIKNRNWKRAYIRGCFLATGSISDPDRSYHLEISFPDKLLAEEFIGYLREFGIESRHIMRKGHYLVYLKEGQDIVDFLNVAGAHGALMQLENIRIIKEMRNQVNRLVNCETANLEKTVNASYRQVENIKFIDEHMGLENLPKNLQEIARLRMENPDVSLLELGKMLRPPLSKSGVNHRLRKIDKISEDLRKRYGIT
ncbi:MAG: DNA-binding protein WhiA [Clostridiaceae bacterium]|nr:DNA-binding protein WhiA [Clostridiaceae bacterium]